MRYRDFFEAARHRGKYERQIGHEGALKFLKSIPKDELDHVGIRMTTIPKTGIHPLGKYRTPWGLCFYPATYYINVKRSNGEIGRAHV